MPGRAGLSVQPCELEYWIAVIAPASFPLEEAAPVAATYGNRPVTSSFGSWWDAWWALLHTGDTSCNKGAGKFMQKVWLMEYPRSGIQIPRL